jgi:hypothetical protein
LPMTLLGRRVNGNMRHNQSCVTVRDRRSNTLAGRTRDSREREL